jgi:hypothetical protein
MTPTRNSAVIPDTSQAMDEKLNLFLKSLNSFVRVRPFQKIITKGPAMDVTIASR